MMLKSTRRDEVMDTMTALQCDHKDQMTLLATIEAYASPARTLWLNGWGEGGRGG